MRSTVPRRLGLAESRDEATEGTDNALGRRCAFGTSRFVLTSPCDVRRVKEEVTSSMMLLATAMMRATAVITAGRRIAWTVKGAANFQDTTAA